MNPECTGVVQAQHRLVDGGKPVKIINSNVEVLMTVEELVDPVRTAIIVVDVQNGIMQRVTSSDGAHEKSRADVVNVQSIIPRIQRLLAVARKAGLPVIYAEFIHRNELGATLIDGPNHYCVRDLTPVPDVAGGTWEAQTIVELAPQAGDVVIRKSRASAMHNTLLDNILKSRGIGSLVITGVVTNGCVLFTAADTMHHGYYPVVIRDCVGAYDPEWHNLALQWMTTQFPVFDSDEVIEVWQKRAVGGFGAESA